jgi:hypothetical protein
MFIVKTTSIAHQYWDSQNDYDMVMKILECDRDGYWFLL